MLDDYDPTADLARARTLPSRWYVDDDVLALEQERVFRATWQWIGRSTELRRGGDFAAYECVGEPIVLTRTQAGELKALANVCRHRAGPVATGRGNRDVLQCAYHGWSYALDGRLRKAAEMEGALELDLSSVCLPEYSAVDWHPLVFVKLDARGPSFEDVLGNIPNEVSAAGFDRSAVELVERGEYLVEANWKVYVDNYLEGYHIPYIHPALFNELDYARYDVVPAPYAAAQIAPLRRDGGTDRTYPPRDDEDRALYYWVFPNLMLNFYPGNLQANAVVPIDSERTVVVFEWYADDRVSRAHLDRAIELSDRVQAEDGAICERVQKGLRSSSYDTGRLSVRRENGVHHFHRLLHAFLNDA